MLKFRKKNELLNIKTYKPEVFPDLIERIWIAENEDEAVELILPPNQYVNLIFPLHNATYEYEKGIIDKPQIEGISLKNTSLTYPGKTKLVGVRFYAFGIYPFIPIPGKEIINKSVNCPLTFEETKELIELHGPPSSGSEQGILQSIYDLLNKLIDQKSYETIKPVKEFYEFYRWNGETPSIAEYCKKEGTNYTTLNRNFTRIVGISPKKFERLIKFRKSLCGLIDSRENLTSISANSGYFDQAHFIRDFKLFLNHTPSAYHSLIKLADKESKIINYNFRLF